MPFSSTNSDLESYTLFQINVDQELIDAVNKRINEVYEDGSLLKISEEQFLGDYIPKKELIEK